MGKREKKAKQAAIDEVRRSGSQPSLNIGQPHPPKKQPVMLAISVILFALWFLFLFVTAVWG